MPLTAFQEMVARLLARNRSPDSYLAGGSAIHIEPNTTRYSKDLDYFQDSVERVAEAFAADRHLLEQSGISLEIQIKLPGYIRAMLGKGGDSTKVEWAHDSAWRFLPTVLDERYGYLLHPIDLAINKVLALAGRDEARDFLDVLELHRKTLSLGALVWAAVGKDPGFTPLSLLELLRRRGKYRPEDFRRLHLRVPVDLPALKTEWLAALEDAEQFITARDPEEIGCLYYSVTLGRFVDFSSQDVGEVVCHYGRPGGVLPRILD